MVWHELGSYTYVQILAYTSGAHSRYDEVEDYFDDILRQKYWGVDNEIILKSLDIEIRSDMNLEEMMTGSCEIRYGWSRRYSLAEIQRIWWRMSLMFFKRTEL